MEVCGAAPALSLGSAVIFRLEVFLTPCASGTASQLEVYFMFILQNLLMFFFQLGQYLSLIHI